MQKIRCFRPAENAISFKKKLPVQQGIFDNSNVNLKNKGKFATKKIGENLYKYRHKWTPVSNISKNLDIPKHFFKFTPYVVNMALIRVSQNKSKYIW